MSQDNTKKEIFPNVNDLKEKLASKVAEFSEEKEEKRRIFEKNLKEASDAYYNNMIVNIKNAIDYMEKQSSAYTCVYVNVPTTRLKWGDEVEDKFIPWHWIHYGFPKRNKKGWSSRDTKFWNQDNPMIFRQLQKLCYDNGYYLYDISDPTRGTRTFFKISVNKELDFEEMNLWHNFNTILCEEEVSVGDNE